MRYYRLRNDVRFLLRHGIRLGVLDRRGNFA
jgi:hypothetical protein